MKMSDDLVSVVMPVFDRERLVAEALRSIVAQRHDALEIVVVDDGSSDATPEVVRAFDGPIRYVHQAHAGVAAARNRGLDEARGRWITFLDSDDVWLDGMLASALRHLTTPPNSPIVHGRAQIVRMSDAGGHRPRFRADTAALHRPLLGSMVFDRSCFEKVGRFDAALKRSEDIDWFARAEELGVEAQRVDEVWLLYRVHATNVTNDIPATTSSIVASVKRALDRRRGPRSS